MIRGRKVLIGLIAAVTLAVAAFIAWCLFLREN